MHLLTWAAVLKRMTALAGVPVASIVIYAYWITVGALGPAGAAIAWCGVVLAPVTVSYAVVPIRGWAPERYASQSLTRAVAHYVATGMGVSLYALAFAVRRTSGDNAGFAVFAAGAGVMAVGALLEPPPRALSLLSTISATLLFLLFALH